MTMLCDAFGSLGLDYVPSAANFVMVRVGPGAQVYDALLHRGVIVRPMDFYGFPEHLRISIGLPAENARCIEALTAVMRELGR